MTMVERYNERPAIALSSVLPHLRRIGAGLSGILGNDSHRYGFHLSPARLRGTGHGDDYSLRGPKNTPILDDRAGCAIDIGMGWPAAGEWLEDTRERCAAGELPQVFELIGDPDLLPGPAKDIKNACYAAASTSWRWVEYEGQGHVTWCHVGIGRKYANDVTFGDQLLGGWTATGRIEEDDMEQKSRIDQPKSGAGKVLVTYPDGNTNFNPELGYLLHFIASTASYTRVEQRVQDAGDQVRDAANTAAINALADLVRAGGGDVDSAAIIAAVNAQGELARAEVRELQLALLAEQRQALEAAAAALGDST